MTVIAADWVRAPASSAVMDAIGTGYFVGGCVRNALLGAPVSDIDISTPLAPDEVTARLEAAGLKAVPTGLQHGTVTAVHEGVAVEVTTFRRDVTTDGRHAEVDFTDDITVDAGRRDFTMNALYADRDGAVIDPLGGLPDLEARRVRFIGQAEDRIREDHLRILRFFRFHAWYGADGIDADGLAACAALAEGVEQLARERIGWEIRKLLSAPDPAPAVASMTAAGVLMRCLPGADPAFLAPLVHLEQGGGFAPDWQTRLSVIGGDDVAARLRFSKAEAFAMQLIRDALASGASISETAYRFGADAARAAALVLAASTGGRLPGDLGREISRGVTARFPLGAKDLLALGYVPGPGLGAELGARETEWITSGFALSKAELLARVPPAPA